jgi:HEAT repeat protein
MANLADGIHAALLPFLAVLGSALFLLVCYVVLLHAMREVTFRRRVRLLTVYRALVASALRGDEPAAIRRLQSSPSRHRSIVASLILEPLKVAEGSLTERARATATALGLISRWESDLRNRRWWVRAEAAHALGLVRSSSAVRALIAALDDPFEEVRAAAVEALGIIGDSDAIDELVARLGEQSRHQRVRLVQALRLFGTAAVQPLLEHVSKHPADALHAADLLGHLEATAALDRLLDWCTHAQSDVRAASVRAIGAIGVNERAYYHLLRALGDEAIEVRAAAAWALGRSGRHDATRYLAARLRDEWMVAAESARALRNLGAAGRRMLESAAAQDDGELARQMLWEIRAASGA